MNDLVGHHCVRVTTAGIDRIALERYPLPDARHCAGESRIDSSMGFVIPWCGPVLNLTAYVDGEGC